MPRVRFEPTTPVLERWKTVHALDRATTVIGLYYYRDGHNCYSQKYRNAVTFHFCCSICLLQFMFEVQFPSPHCDAEIAVTCNILAILLTWLYFLMIQCHCLHMPMLYCFLCSLFSVYLTQNYILSNISMIVNNELENRKQPVLT
jgi:hypothetical protein